MRCIMSSATHGSLSNSNGILNERHSGHLDRRQSAAAIASVVAFALADLVVAAQAQTVQLIAVDVKAVEEGYKTSKLVGSNVRNDKDEKIGTLDDLIVTKDQKLYAVLQVGGFLGLGGHLIAIPYESLNISDDGRKITLAGASKEAIAKLPEFKYGK